MIKTTQYYSTIDSTNKQLKEHHHDYRDGTLIYTDYQTDGVGRRGAKWQSAKGKNLLFSFILKTRINNPEFVLMRSALAVVKTLERLGIEAKIKLPNDILVKRKKIAGILIERKHFVGNQITIVGIGLNVNEIMVKEEARTSIKMIKKKSLRRRDLLNTFITYFNQLKDEDMMLLFTQSLLTPTRVKYQNRWFLWGGLTEEQAVLLQNEEGFVTAPIHEVEFDYSI